MARDDHHATCLHDAEVSDLDQLSAQSKRANDASLRRH